MANLEFPMTDPGSTPRTVAVPLVCAIVAIVAVLGGLLIGYEPVGGDPDRIFRPIKAELARAIAEGRLPFWSDRFGLGIPLIAESHVAAFYPPNQLLYRFLDVSTAYRLSMWGHYVLMVAATFAYARRLNIEPWGAAVASVSFALCGFLTINSSHEWAYHTLAYLPVCLLAVDHFAHSGRCLWLALLALAWGCQIVVGHFQVQMWTAGLVLVTGGWRIIADRRPLWRLVALPLGLAWGAGVAAVQLVPTWELAQLVGQTRRSYEELSFYSYPPSHWPEVAIPGLYRWLKGGPESTYWFSEQTTGFEACLFVGTIPLILAFIGLFGGAKDRLTPWRLMLPASLALATMPRWWPQGYAMILQLPGLGYFRCPARYTAVVSFALALLAGRGFDRSISGRRFNLGLILAILFGLAAFSRAIVWFNQPDSKSVLGFDELATALGLAAITWALGLWALLAWRKERAGAWLPFVLVVIEMGVLFHAGTTKWGWSVPLPASSPILTYLAEHAAPDARIEGPLDNLPIRAGLTTATPYVGFPLPAPYGLLKAATDPNVAADPVSTRWLKRLGVTHAVRDAAITTPDAEVLFRSEDRALDGLAIRPAGVPERRSWSVVRLPDPFPAVRVATRAVKAPDRSTLITALSDSDAQQEAWSLPDSRPPAAQGPRARSARILNWHGLAGEVEHDGECDLILNQAYYPGWFAQLNTAPETPAWPADGGLIAVRLAGSGVTRVTLKFHPTGWNYAAPISTIATIMALLVTVFGVIRRPAREPSEPEPDHKPIALADGSP
jgi:hypothetical protein